MKKKMISFMTAVSCSAGMLLYLPPVMRTFAAEIVSNDFETTYGGWYESGDGVCLQRAAGLGTGGSKGMQVTGRHTPDEGAASDKHFYLSGGISYDYSVQVRSDAAETFRLKLCYTCGGAAQTVTLDTKTSKAGAWTALSAKYRAPENAENLTLTYIRAFFEDNPGKTIADAIKCWKYKKSRKGHNQYERADLISLEK